MDFFLQEVVNGLTLGSMYALIALGYSLVYGVLRLLNFAHGDVFMIGGVIGYGVVVAPGVPPRVRGPQAPNLRARGCLHDRRFHRLGRYGRRRGARRAGDAGRAA